MAERCQVQSILRRRTAGRCRVSTRLANAPVGRCRSLLLGTYGTRRNVAPRPALLSPACWRALTPRNNTLGLVLLLRLHRIICVKSLAVLAIRQASAPRIVRCGIPATPRHYVPRPTASAILRCRNDDARSDTVSSLRSTRCSLTK